MNQTTVEKINDPRLNDKMSRTRCGSRQEFTKEGNNNWHNPDVVLDPKEKHLFADLIEGEWFWVNGCNVCNSEREKYCYIRCETHDICCECKIKRADAKGGCVWGHEDGFMCSKCHDAAALIRKAEAQARISKEYDSWDFSGLDDVTCPWCEKVLEESHEIVPDPSESVEYECDDCENTFIIEPEVSVSFSMTRKEKTENDTKN